MGNAKNKNLMTPLHKACMCGFDSVAKKLLEYGADVDVADHEGNTPIHFAARSGFVNVVNVLFENGANITLKNKAKKTAVEIVPVWEVATKKAFDVAQAK